MGPFLLGTVLLSLLGDPGSDDFMASLRINFHPGRKTKNKWKVTGAVGRERLFSSASRISPFTSTGR